MRRIIVAGMFVTGISLIVTAMGAVLAPDLLGEPGGLVALFAGVFIAISGLFGGKISEWADTIFGKKKDKPQPITDIDQQVKEMKGGVVAGTIGTLNYTPTPEPEVHDTIGFIPPAQTDTYVHRGKIEEDIRSALRKGGASAIVGLHAPGGTGKTELAKQIAWEVNEGKFEFKGVLWVDVNEKTPPEVINEALRKCGLQIQPSANDADKKAELQHFLLNQRLLVIFDDVRENAAQGLRDILPPAPCAALITSRIQQMAGIRDFPLDRMEPEQARTLFVNSLGEDAVKTEEQAVSKLAERCKYNPLALEIASRRIRQNRGVTNPIGRYFEKVEKRFEELKMHGDERWNLTAVFDLSYNDLSQADQARFRALAVFASSGFSPSAAAHIWEMDEATAGETISRFINLSLVIPVEGNFERFRLHDLLDEYAAPKLDGAGEVELRALRLAEWLIELFDDHYTDDVSNAPEVGLEFANLARTADWAIASQNAEVLARLATKPRNWLFNYFREFGEWLHWLETSIKLDFEDIQLKANVRKAVGDVQQFRKETDAALASYHEALKLFRQVGAKLGEANIYLSLGGSKRTDRDFVGAKVDFQNAFNAYKLIGDQYSQARALYRLGDCLLDEERFQEALSHYEQAAQLWHLIGVDNLVESILNPRIEEAKKHLREIGNNRAGEGDDKDE